MLVNTGQSKKAAKKLAAIAAVTNFKSDPTWSIQGSGDAGSAGSDAAMSMDLDYPPKAEFLPISSNSSSELPLHNGTIVRSWFFTSIKDCLKEKKLKGFFFCKKRGFSEKFNDFSNKLKFSLTLWYGGCRKTSKKHEYMHSLDFRTR